MARAKKNPIVEPQDETPFVETQPEEAVIETLPEEVNVVVLEFMEETMDSTITGAPAESSVEPEQKEPPVEAVEADQTATTPIEVAEPVSEEKPTKPAEKDDVASPVSEEPISSDSPENPETPATEDDGVINLTLSLPLAMFEQSLGSMQRLKAAISSKQTLLKKALGTDSLDVVIEEDRVTFPWFKTTEQDSPVEVDAYSKLVFALAKKAITQTRVDPVEKVPDDLQLGMRLYLINLQFKGDEFKSARAVLMKNFKSLSRGSSVGSTKYELTMPEVYKP